ncbi:cytochrome [Pseudoalteromonas luteoviolacea]|uniref:Cytochrome n=1 Tax=Pseudoalteromonas luteoviolacea TaxID=43657 RepID=A0A1C0TMU1_9GAMM|nr:cytochrome b/b6 domain-containing protein [Pseudoalteromonas luteoviolacea]MBQ4812016.1 cytochrome b/b6 domain-containing protein [Pseudoalteromonas luteoviolacea]OCQ20148.1 cytochrome [Pseudoalteromonas luteoviolacea]
MTKVWDGFIRGFHWLLVVGIAVLYFSGEEGWLDLHFVVGYLLLALMITRIIWGIIGSDTAKLSSLFHRPKYILAALKSKSQHVGHNPAGSIMVLIFFLLIFIQLISGLMTTDDILMEGPLVAYISYELAEFAGDIHHLNIDILLIAIAIHIIAIVMYRIKGINLVKPLVTGKSNIESTAPKMRKGWVAYVIFLLIAAVVLYVWGQEPLNALF